MQSRVVSIFMASVFWFYMAMLLPESVMGEPRITKQVTVLVLYSEAMSERQPTSAQIQLFRKRYVFLKHSDTELSELLPKTIIDYANVGTTLPLLEAFVKFRKVRQQEGKSVIPLEVIIVPWKGALTRLHTDIPDPALAPDVLMMPSTWCTFFIDKHLLISLHKFIEGASIDPSKSYEPAVLTPCQHPKTGALFGLPATVDLRQLYVWKRMRQGDQEITLLENPLEQLRTVTALRYTLEQLQIVLAKYLPQVRPFAIPNHPEDWSKVHTFINWLWLFGEDFWHERERRFVLTSAAARDAVDYLMRLSPYIDIADNKMMQDVEENFIHGQSVMHIGIPHTVELLRQHLGSNWSDYITVMSMPEGPSRPANFLGGTSWTITRQAEQRHTVANAWELVRFLALNTDAQRSIADGAGHLPATRGALAHLVKEKPDYQPVIAGVRDGRSFPRYAHWAQVVETRLALDYVRNLLIHIRNQRHREAHALLKNAEDALNNIASQEASSLVQFIMEIAGIIAMLGLAIFLLSRRREQATASHAIPGEHEKDIGGSDEEGPRQQKASLPSEVDKAVEAYEEDSDPYGIGREAGIICASHGRMERILAEVLKAAKSEASVLILGEPGTGKELIARAIHNNSSRRDKAWVAINCGAIPRELLESEIFGHEKGAFTGATALRPGRFELANGGTIFLDEIGEMDPALQVKLLRVLQEREFERIGGTRTIKVDVRVLAATNKNLEDLVAQQQFRDDLYWRLNVIPLTLPPLRERREDIPYLIDYAHQTYASRYGKERSYFDSKTQLALLCYHWPGNVRQLLNFIERLYIQQDGVVSYEELLPAMQRAYDCYEKSGGCGGIIIGLKNITLDFLTEIHSSKEKDPLCILTKYHDVLKNFFVKRNSLDEETYKEFNNREKGMYTLLCQWLRDKEKARKALIKIVAVCIREDGQVTARGERSHIIDDFLGMSYRNISKNVREELNQLRSP